MSGGFLVSILLFGPQAYKQRQIDTATGVVRGIKNIRASTENTRKNRLGRGEYNFARVVMDDDVSIISNRSV